MSTKQATLEGTFRHTEDEDTDDDDEFVCPLCGDEDVTSVGLPDHIASDDCDTEHKEVRYDD